MTRDDSLMVKGAAVLLMVFLHLFNSLGHCALCTPLLMIGDKPLVFYLTRACGPVPFFLFVSGVGLYISYRNGRSSRTPKRILKLYIHFWVILTIFLIIGHLMKPEVYPGSLTTMIANYSSLYYNYSAQTWFLLPYALIALSSPFWFRIFDRFNYWIPLLLTFVISLGISYVVKLYGNYLFNHELIYTPLLYFQLMFPFVLGMTCVRTDFWGAFEKLKKCNGFVLWLALILLVAARCLIVTGIVQSLFVLAFIILFVAAPKAQFIQTIFKSLGKHSMNIWLIHTWFCYYLFQDFIYGFKYPIVIFIVLVLISYLSSMLVNFIVSPITKRIR